MANYPSNSPSNYLSNGVATVHQNRPASLDLPRTVGSMMRIPTLSATSPRVCVPTSLANCSSRRGGPTVRRGFTLIEIVVTVVLIAVAAALVVPQMGGVTGSSGDRVAQNTAQAAISASMSFYRGAGAFPPATTPGATQMASVNPELTYTASTGTGVGASTGLSNVSFATLGSIFAVAVSGCTLVAGVCGAGTYRCWFERKNLTVTAVGAAVPTDAVDLYATQPSTSGAFNCTGYAALAINNYYSAPLTPLVGAAWTQPIVMP